MEVSEYLTISHQIIQKSKTASKWSNSSILATFWLLIIIIKQQYNYFAPATCEQLIIAAGVWNIKQNNKHTTHIIFHKITYVKMIKRFSLSDSNGWICVYTLGMCIYFCPLFHHNHFTYLNNMIIKCRYNSSWYDKYFPLRSIRWV